MKPSSERAMSSDAGQIRFVHRRPHSKRFAWTPIAAGLAVILFLVSPMGAQALERDAVLHLVPEDMGFCLVIQDWRGQAHAMAGSAFDQAFWKSPLGQHVQNSPEGRRLAETQTFIRTNLNVDWEQVRDEILGDLVVLAYRPGPPDKPEQETGLFLVQARNAELLATLIDRMNHVQKEAGDLQLQIHQYEGREYVQRTDHKGSSFYYLHGPLLVFSQQEELLRQVMDREQQSQGESRIARDLKRLHADQALAALWINPRAFEAEIEHHAEQAADTGCLAQRALLTYWRALEAISVSLWFEKSEVDVRLAFLARDTGNGPNRKLFVGESRSSELWQSFPARSIVAVAGRIDSAGWDDFLESFLSSDARRALLQAVERGPQAALGVDLFHDVLPNIGPDWGMCAARPAGEGWFPQLLWALRVQPGKSQPPADDTLLDALKTLARVSVLAYNANHVDELKLNQAHHDKIQISYLTNPRQFPPGLEPAFALKEGYLLIASSPDAIQSFHVVGKPEKPSADVPLVRVSLEELRHYLQDWRRPLSAYVAARHQMPRADAEKLLRKLEDAIQLYRTAELSERAEKDQMSLLLRVRTEVPLRR